MKVEVAPMKDGRLVITILPEEDGVPQVTLKEKEVPPEPVAEKPQEEEEVPPAFQDDPHMWEEIEKAQKAKRTSLPQKNGKSFTPPTEKQIRYFHYLARKAGIKDTHAWMEKNGFPASSRDCSQAQLSKAIDLLKDLEWAHSLEAPGWRSPEPAEAA